MQLKDYRRIVNRHASLPYGPRLDAYREAARLRGLTPLSRWEKQISHALVTHNRSKRRTWYHGGLAGRVVGDLLLPSHVTGANPRGVPASYRVEKDRVYVTFSFEGAEFFARANLLLGAESQVYVVEPQGAMAVDPEALRLALILREDPLMTRMHLAHIGDFLSRFTCKAAKVVEVLEVGENSV